MVRDTDMKQLGTLVILLLACVNLVGALYSHLQSPWPCKLALQLGTNTTKLDCSGTKIKELPIPGLSLQVMAAVNELDLSKNRIKECPSYAFVNLSNLILLDLHDNMIRYFHPLCFAGLGNLLSLDIRFYNKIVGDILMDIPQNIFQSLISLEKLYVSSTDCDQQNQMDTQDLLPGKLFANLIKLKVFSITGLPLIKFPQEFQNLTSIREIYWAYDCTNEPILQKGMFENLQNSQVETLSIVSQAGYRNTPLEVEADLQKHLPKLHRLNFGCTYHLLQRTLNRLKALSNLTFTELLLDNLQVGVLGAHITHDTFCAFKELTQLSVKNNNIRTIDPISRHCLPKLKYIAIGKNAPIIDTADDSPTFFMGVLPDSLETLSASYFLQTTRTLPTTVCYATNSMKAFDDWTKPRPKLPKPDPVPEEQFPTSQSYWNSEDFKDKYPDAVPNYLPPHLKYLFLDNGRQEMKWISGNNDNVLFFFENDLQMADLHNSGPVEYFTSPLLGMNKLQIINFNSVGIRHVSPGLMYHFPNLRIVHAAKNKLGLDGGNAAGLAANATKLLSIDISENNFLHLDADSLNDNKELVIFNVSKNNLKNFNLDLRFHKNLRLLSLEGNQLTHLDEKVTAVLDDLHSTLKPLEMHHEYLDLLDAPNDTIVVDLRNNELKCECSTLDFMNWIQTTQVTLLDIKDLTCSDGSAVDQRIVDINMLMMQVKCKMLATLVVILLSVVFIAIVLAYRFRWKIRWHYYIIKKRMATPVDREVEDDQFGYDAFVAHNHDKDRGWVINTLLPRVEKQWGMRLFLGYRDFPVGCPISEAIVDAIEKSRKVILLVTPNFVNSPWCDFEMNMALVSRMNDIIIIYKDPVENNRNTSKTLLALLRARLYIKWTEDPDGQNLFWQKLQDCLKQNRPTTWDNIALVDTEL